MISQNTAQSEGQSTYPQAATLESSPRPKRYPGAERAGDRRPLLRGPRRRDLRARRPVGLRQDDGDAAGQPHDRDDERRHPARRAPRARPRAGRAAPRDRLRDPADRALPAPHGRARTSPRCRGCWAGTRRGWRRAWRSCSTSSALDHELRDRYPRQLSGGQRQRVGVARALAADPPLMLMDEPFGAIDPINRERLQDEFLRLQRRIAKTVVFVTHDIDEAISWATASRCCASAASWRSTAARRSCSCARPTTSSRTSSAPTAP